MIINGLFTKDTIGATAFFAADVNFDGTVDAADLDLITKAGLKQHTINQNRNSSTASVTTSDDITVEDPDVENNEPGETTQTEHETFNFAAIIRMIMDYIEQILDAILSYII